MKNKTLKQLWEEFRIENPNTVGGFQEQYESFKWLYNRLKGTNDSSISIQQNNMTAVEWLVNEINKMNVSREATLFINRLKDQAKQMEQKQHEETFHQSRRALDECMPPVWESWEQYYNETYGKK